MSKKSKAQARKKKQGNNAKRNKKDAAGTSPAIAKTAVMDKLSIQESLKDVSEFVLDKEDAAKYFKEFLLKHPGIEDADPAHEAAQWYLINKSLRYSRNCSFDGAEAAVEEYFAQLAHKWEIYPQIYPDGPKIPENI